MSARILDLGRSRSRFVFDRAKLWKEKESREITAKAQGLPVALRSQGLIVTMARLASGEDTASRTLNGMLFNWLTGENTSFGLKSKPATPGDFLELMATADRPTYLAVQREALALAERIKLISKAFFSGKEENHGG